MNNTKSDEISVLISDIGALMNKASEAHLSGNKILEGVYLSMVYQEYEYLGKLLEEL